jgi:hypothetical protein
MIVNTSYGRVCAAMRTETNRISLKVTSRGTEKLPLELRRAEKRACARQAGGYADIADGAQRALRLRRIRARGE